MNYNSFEMPFNRFFYKNFTNFAIIEGLYIYYY